MLSIIIPVMNEPYIQELVCKINSIFFSNLPQIIIVDKSEVVPKFKEKNVTVVVQKSVGLGNAFKEGLKEVKGNHILLMDGDGSHDPELITTFVHYSRDNDFVIGYKAISEDSFPRKIVSKVMNFVARKRLGLPYRDMMSGFFLIDKNLLERVRMNPSGFKILMELLYKTKDFKPRVKEIPIIFHKRKAGKSKVGFNKNGLKELVRVWTLMGDLKSGKA
jgi:dolichol-phosphate mannosyltransferase